MSGKGSTRRPLSVSPARFGAEYDRIFGQPVVAQPPAVATRPCGCGSRVYVDDHAGARCFLCGMGAR